MTKISLALCAVVFVAGCSSAGLPGSDNALEQVDKATRVLLASDLRNAFVAEEAYFAQYETYSTDLAALNLRPSQGVTITIARVDATTFCAQVTDGETTLHRSKEDLGPEEGPC